MTKAEIKHLIIKIMRENLSEIMLSNKDIDFMIEKNAGIINLCVDEYIKDYGMYGVDEELLDEYISRYF